MEGKERTEDEENLLFILKLGERFNIREIAYDRFLPAIFRSAMSIPSARCHLVPASSAEPDNTLQPASGVIIEVKAQVLLPVARRQNPVSDFDHIRQVGVVPSARAVVALAEGVVQPAAEIHHRRPGMCTRK